MTQVCIVGTGHTRFGRLGGETLESLIVSAVREALDEAGLQPIDIDAIFLGNFNAGLMPDAFASSLALQASDAFRFTPAARLENACASGSAVITPASTKSTQDKPNAYWWLARRR